MSEIEALYHSLKETGELFDMFPKLKGVWEKDKKFFMSNYEENKKILNDNYLDFDEECCDSEDF